ncbi:SDR family NAD(P)-dependent oxidoreductase [Streptomyces sp. NPDC090032]|uniref:SDR family NAD(P)-dependent oxidoreductase n=1 Tax=Streptomyces sp. NPDC090032 TaxID=3365925 RepID=UPI003827C9B4
METPRVRWGLWGLGRWRLRVFGRRGLWCLTGGDSGPGCALRSRIVGASQGIGAAVARRFASQGARLVTGARNVRALEALRDELRGQDTRSARSASTSPIAPPSTPPCCSGRAACTGVRTWRPALFKVVRRSSGPGPTPPWGRPAHAFAGAAGRVA